MTVEERKTYLANLEFHNELTPLHERYMQDDISLEEFLRGIEALQEYWKEQLTFELESED